MLLSGQKEQKVTCRNAAGISSFSLGAGGGEKFPVCHGSSCEMIWCSDLAEDESLRVRSCGSEFCLGEDIKSDLRKCTAAQGGCMNAFCAYQIYFFIKALRTMEGLKAVCLFFSLPNFFLPFYFFPV